MSVGICRCLVLSGCVLRGVLVYLGDILGCLSWSGVSEGVFVGSVPTGSSQAGAKPTILAQH